jgi:murein endopeptidase
VDCRGAAASAAVFCFPWDMSRLQVAALAVMVGVALVASAAAEDVRTRVEEGAGPLAIEAERPRIDWRPSIALGEPFENGRLVNGVLLPREGRDFSTWDPVLDRFPNRSWRRWGTDRLLRTFLRIAREYHAANQAAPRLVVGDLSRPHGGEFGRRFGGIGHASHQNGLDIDIYYPRRDRAERPPRRVAQVDSRLAAELVHRFVRAGAEFVFVGPNTGLGGPRRIVQPLVHHDNHMHVRLRNPLPTWMRTP